jgi:hypothetical protein
VDRARSLAPSRAQRSSKAHRQNRTAAITRMKSDPKSFLLCPYNVRLQPRRLMIAPAAVGCKPMLGNLSHYRNMYILQRA